jgi:hypothetical protein
VVRQETKGPHRCVVGASKSVRVFLQFEQSAHRARKIRFWFEHPIRQRD